MKMGDKSKKAIQSLMSADFFSELENPIHEKFARLVAAGQTMAAAGREAGITGKARTLGAKPIVRARIGVLRQKACQKVDVTVDGVLSELIVLKEVAWLAGDLKLVQSLLNDISRIGGVSLEGSAKAVTWREVAGSIAAAKGLTLDDMKQIASDNALVDIPILPEEHKFH